MEESIDKLIGKGLQFPFEPTESHGVKSSTSIDRINQSLFILFETRKGSRIMMPDFGSNLYLYRFDPFDNVLMERIRETITEDVRKWEPRVQVTSIKFLDNAEMRDTQTLYISINYKVINTQVSGNYVYPFRRDTYEMSEDSVMR